MATRVNTRFILVLLIAIVTAGGIVGALWFLQYRTDATRNIRKGDQFAQAGQWEEARGQYGRAVQKDPGRVEYIDKLEEATLKVKPETPDQARELYNAWVQLLRQRSQHFAEHERLLTELHAAARAGVMNWATLADAADTILQQLPPEDDSAANARFYRAVANVQRQTAMTERERETIPIDLQAYLDINPTSDEALAAMMRHQILLASQLYATDQRSLAREQLVLAEATYQSAVEKDAVGPRVASMKQALSATSALLGGDFDQDAFLVATDDLAAIVRENLAELDEMFMIEVMTRLSAPRGGTDRTISIAQEWIDMHPPAYDLRLEVANLESRRQQLESAVGIASEVLRELEDPANQPTNSLASVRLYPQRARAAYTLFGIAFDQWDRASADDKPALLAAAEKAYEDLRMHAQIADRARLAELAAGRLAFARGDDREAIDLLERAVTDNTDSETLRVLAAAHQRAGNLGLAHERISAALANAQQDMRINYDNARYALALRRLDAARPSIALLEQAMPGDRRVEQLRAEYDRLARGDAENLAGANDPVGIAFETAADQMSRGEFDEARSLLTPLLNDERYRVAALEMLARVEYSDDNRAAASEYLTQALEEAPTAQSLLRLQAVFENDDPIDALIQFCESTHTEPGRVALAMLSNLSAYVRAWQGAAEQAKAAGDLSRATEAEQLIARAESELEKYLKQAEEFLPANDPGLFEYQFSTALLEKRWSDAEALLAMHNSADNRWNIDGCDGMLFRGRLELMRGDPQAATTTLLEATQRAPYSPQAWRTLGVAYGQLGNTAEALRAYEQAYNSNPNNIATALVFVASLLQTGEDLRALAILNDLRRLAPRNKRVLDQYLNVLAQTGDESQALEERLAIYREDPMDVDNSLRLALLLVTVVPRQELIFNARGERMYSARQWSQMSPDQRRTALGEARAQWASAAEKILNDLEAELGSDARIINARAAMLEARGRGDEAIAYLQRQIESTPRDSRSVDQYLTLSGLAVRLDRLEYAAEQLREAQAYESQSDQRATIGLGDVLFQMNRLEEAKETFLSALEQERARNVELKLIDTLIRLGELSDAETRLDSVVADLGADMTSWILAANLSARQAGVAEKDGRVSEADFHREQVVNNLGEAARVNPRSTAPLMQLARYQYQRFLQTRDSSHLDAALRNLDRADQIDSRNEQSRLLRVDLLLAKGDRRGAIGSLRRYVEDNPGNDRARVALMTMLTQSGQTRDAETLIRDAISRQPESAVWQVRLGDHLRNSGGSSSDVIAAFTAALDIDPTQSVIDKLVLYLLSSGVDNPQRAESVLLRHSAIVNDDAILLTDSALVEDALDRTANAEDRLARAYAIMMDSATAEESRRPMLSRWVNAAIRILDQQPSRIESFARAQGGDAELHPEVLRGLGRLSVALDRADLTPAFAYYQRAVDAVPGSDARYRAGLEFELGTLQTLGSQWDAALKTFERVLAVIPDHVLALNNYAYILAEEMNNPQKALDPAQRAAAAAADNPSVRDTLGRVHFLLGNLDEAARELQASIDLSESASALVHMAEVEIARERFTQADSLLQRAMQLQPDSKLEADIRRLTDDIRTRNSRP